MKNFTHQFLVTFFLVCIYNTQTNAQTPGTNHPGIQYWFKANSGVTIINGNQATSWQNQKSGGANATGVNAPLKIENSINFNPAINFNGSTNYFNLNLDQIKNNDYTIIAVVERNSGKDSNYFIGTTSFNNNEGLHMGYRDSSTLTLDQYANGVNASVNAFNASQNSPAIVIGRLDRKKTNFDPVFGRGVIEIRDGELKFSPTANDVTTPISGSGGGKIGRAFNHFGFEGNVAEIIIYNRAVASGNLYQIYSYLAMKYGVTLESSTAVNSLSNRGDYEGNGGSPTFWDSSHHIDYHNNIAVVVRDDASGLLQKKSKSESPSAILTIEKPGNISPNKEAIAVGSNNQSIAFTTANAPTNYKTTNRIWKMHKTGSINGITLSFEVPGNTGVPEHYTLLQKTTDANFTSGVTYKVASSIVGNTIVFTNVSTNTSSSSTLNSGGQVTNNIAYFTLAENQNVKAPVGLIQDLKLWLKADNGLSVNSNNDIFAWQDVSYNRNNATAVNTPTKNIDAINFNPTVSLNGDSEYFNVNLDGIKNSDYNIFAVLKRSNDNDSNYFIGTNRGSNNEGLHFGYRNNTSLTLDQYGNEISFNVNAYNQPRVSTALIRGQLDSGTNRLLTELRDGVFKSNANSNGTPLTGNGQGRLGKGFGNEGFEGEIAEVIVYSKTLSAQEVKKIDSYLAIKYGLILDTSGGGTNGDYITSNGTTIWDASANTDYHNHITIITKDDTSDLHQPKSKSEAFNSVLTLEKTGGISTDNQAIAIGSNNLDLTFTTANAPANFETTNRIWKMQKTGNLDNVTLSFEIAGNTGNVEDYVLLQNSSPSFTNNEAYFTATSISGDIINFTGVSTSNNVYFTLAKGQVPLSFSSNLKLWLKADAGVITNGSNQVTFWQDQSARGSSTTAVNSPTLTQNAINFNPAVYLPNGDNDFFNVNLDAIKNTDYTLIAVVERDNSNSNSYVLGTRSTTQNQGLHFGYRSNGTLALAQYGNDVNLAVNNFNTPVISPAIISGKLDQNTGRIVSELRDATLKNQSSTSTEPLTGNASGQLGRGFDNTGFEGNIAEVIAYSSALSDVEENKIMSYLAIKYGLTLDKSGGGTNGDYVSSDGNTNYWDASANDGYHSDITIITKDDGFGLEQLKSKSENANAVLTIEKNGGATNDKYAIAIGNNDLSMNYTHTNAPINREITERIWKVQKTEFVTGTVNISIDVNNYNGTLTEYGLLRNNSTNFSSGSNITLPTSVTGNTLHFTNVNLDKTYFTLSKKSDPRMVSLNPLNNTTNVSVSDNLEITFTENVVKNSGNISILKTSDDTIIEVMDVNSANIAISGAIVTINPTNNLDVNENYYVIIGATALKDAENDTFAGILNKSIWSFQTGFTSPSGISSGLKLWLKANKGVTVNGSNEVTTWQEQSANQKTADAINTPQKIENAINHNPVISFNGSNEAFQITNGILGTNTYTDMWVYSVQNVKRIKNSYLFYEDMASGNRFGAHVPWSNGYAYFDFGVWSGLGRVQTNTSVVDIDVPTLWTLSSSTSTSTPSGNRKDISKNGKYIASNNNDNTSESRTGNNSNFYIGTQSTSGGAYYEGDIAEMIIYTKKPTAFQQQKIQSYLAIKYGITLDRTDLSSAITEGHYLNSDGTIIWNTYDNASYHNNIAVITKDDGSFLLQNESKSENANTVLSLGKSGGITTDKDAIAVGSNNQPFTLSPTNAPSGYNISSRVWKMQKTGNLDNIFFRFEIPNNTGNISDYQVIMSTSNTNFATGITTFPATSIQGNTVNVNNITTVDGNYYVLAERIIPPVISSLSPTNNSNNYVLQNSIEITFSEDILKNSGNIILYNADDNTILETIDVNSSKVTISNSIATITPTYTFAFAESYYILIDNGAFTDTTLNPFTGIASASIWNFSFSQNTAPTFTSVPVTNAGENILYNYQVKTTDVDLNNVTVTAVTKPSWLTLETTTTVSTLAGTGLSGFVNGDGSSARFNSPYRLTVDANDDIYVADFNNNRIRKVLQTGFTSTYTGNSTTGATDGTRPSYNRPTDVSFDTAGNLYIADRNNHRIRKVTPAKVTSTLAGSSSGFINGNGASARFNFPTSLVVDANNNVFVTDYTNHRIRKITPSGVVTTFAGSSEGTDDGTLATAKFNRPRDIVIDSKGNFFVLEYGNHRIRKITPSGNVTNFAGSSRGFRDGIGTNAQFSDPLGLAIDSKNNLYVADYSNSRIRKITSEGVVSTLIGANRQYTDGTADVARVAYARGITADSQDNLFFTDGNNIRKIVTQTQLFGTPTTADIGNHNVVLEVNDGKGGVTQQSFTITVSDVIAPTITTLLPANNATINTVDANLEITFSENIQANTGNIVIYKSDDTVVETISANSSAVTINNSLVTINPSNNLDWEEGYYINIDNTAFSDTSNNAFAGISDKTTWAFTSERPTNNYQRNGGFWSTPGSWSLGRIPNRDDNVVVLSGRTGVANIDVEMHNLTNLGTTTVDNSSAITVNGDFTNSSSFTINSDETESGVLQVEGTATGIIIYKRGGLLANKWSLVSAPLENQNILAFAQNPDNKIRVNTSVNPNRYAIAYYDDNLSLGNKWQYYNTTTDANLSFTNGQSYAMSRSEDGEVTFTGTLATTDASKNLSASKWNAIGNPYTTYYPLNKNSNSSFLGDNSVNLSIPAVYTWSNSQDKYVAITNLVTSTDRFLPPGLGFFVKSNTTTNINFRENKRRKKPSSGTHIFNKTANTTPFVKVFIEKEYIKVNTDVIFSDTATNGFDNTEDIENFNGATFDINTHLVEGSEGKNFTIQSLPKSEIGQKRIPLSITANKNDEIIFSANKVNFPTGLHLYLEDVKNDSFTELTNGVENTVTLLENTNGIGRFYLHTSNAVLNTNQVFIDKVELYSANDLLHIKGLQGEYATINLYDVLGKKVLTKKIKEDTQISLQHLTKAIYVVELIQKSNKIRKKISTN